MNSLQVDDDDDEDDDDEDDFAKHDSDEDDDDDDADEDDEEEEETWQVFPLTSPIEVPRLAGISSSAKLGTPLDRAADVVHP